MTMKMILSKLKPSLLTIILFLILILLQVVFFGSSSITYSINSNIPQKIVSTHGIGSSITIITQAETTFKIKWLILFINLALCYFLSLLFATAIRKTTKFRRPAMIYGFIGLVMIIGAFFVSIIISKVMWGYYFFRPPVFTELKEIVKVNAVIPLNTEVDDNGNRFIVVKKNFFIEGSIASYKTYSYDCIVGRQLLVLQNRDLLPESHSTVLNNLPDLYPLIKASKILAEHEEGYDDSDLVDGILIDTYDKNGIRFVFLGLTGRQVSNDTYPYYEMLFSAPHGSSALSYVRGQRFFFDIAGLEGLEWYVMWPTLSIFCIVSGFIIFTVGIGFYRVIKKIKKGPKSIASKEKIKKGVIDER